MLFENGSLSRRLPSPAGGGLGTNYGSSCLATYLLITGGKMSQLSESGHAQN